VLSGRSSDEQLVPTDKAHDLAFYAFPPVKYHTFGRSPSLTDDP